MPVSLSSRTPLPSDRNSDAENLSDAAAILRDLVRTTQYELRSLINQIIGYTELLQEDAIQLELGPCLTTLEQVRTAGRSLLVWLAATLDLDRVAAGKLDAAAVSDARASAKAILGWCRRLRRDVLRGGWPEAIPDLEMIESASLSLINYLEQVTELSHFRVGVGAVPSLPQERSLALQAMARARAAIEADASDEFTSARLLVVEANDAQRDLLSRRLTRLGHRVSSVADGFSALEAIRAEEYDLVLLSVILPEMDGAAVLEAMKRDEQLRTTPVIMLSALDQIEWVTQCIELGAEDYLPKPFEPMVLQARVEASLEKRRLRLKEIVYLREVARVTEAAMAVEAGSFSMESLNSVAEREDGLGHLARVFQSMVREVRAREEQLRREVQELRIEIDTAKRNQEVSKITDTDYFQRLREQARSLRNR